MTAFLLSSYVLACLSVLAVGLCVRALLWIGQLEDLLPGIGAALFLIAIILIKG